jgi:3-phenylpropionate/trans-cinnamate dioxygenase ferredoxin subunit
MASGHVVCRLSELPPGNRRIVTLAGRSIGVLNVDGTLHALRNSCPHQNGPLCLGLVRGTTVPGKPYEVVYARENEIIKCPWHGWEFEIATGRSIFNPHRVRVRAYEVTVERPDDDDPQIETYPVTIEDGWVVVHV